MPSLKQSLLSYMETLSGERLDLAVEGAARLPLHLRERYRIYSARLFGRAAFLALQAEKWKGGSPAEYAKQAAALALKFNGRVILVLRFLPSYARGRMVRMGVPFIVPGSQTFIPDGLIDLRETFPRPSPRRRDTLSPAAQCTLLYHLLRGPLTGIPLMSISRTLRYSAMRLTEVKDELEGADVCKAVRIGRAVFLEFESSGHVLWERIKPQLRSPVKRTLWVQWRNKAALPLLAGISALSLKTMIEGDRLSTYATSVAAYQDSLANGDCVETRDPESATSKLEVWSYDPQLLGQGGAVDSLSLYLALRASADERVQQQLDRLIEEVKW
jgi:hypothetical protein